MKDWRKILIHPNAPLLDAIRIIDEGALQIALVVDDNDRLLGTITDGDVRRTLLEQKPLDAPVNAVMCTNPMVAHECDDFQSVIDLMRKKDILQIPLVNDAGKIVGLRSLKDLVVAPQQANIVVLMAGGLGTRLRPLTDNCPKPMLSVGGKPILETIVENFIEHGYRSFIFCVNYMSDIIIQHFGDGSKWDISITYVKEDKRMGTAGSLSLLPSRPDKPFFVMNADLLTKTNFKQLMDFHSESGSVATMCVREYEFQVPFGVVHTEGNKLVSIEEKPKHNFFVNAGIYVLDPTALDLIPTDTFYDMPDLYRAIVATEKTASCFPIREYWLDIGRMDDFQRAETEYGTQFCSLE